MSEPKRVVGKHACEACRKSKIKCFTETLAEHGKCRKCLAAGVGCEWKEISTTRRRKRTDARVGELERQIRGLESALSHLGSTDASFRPIDDSDVLSRPLRGNISTGTSAAALEATPTSDGTPASSGACLGRVPNVATNADTFTYQKPDSSNLTTSTESTYPEVDNISTIGGMGTLSSTMRQTLLHTFITRLLPQYPILAFSESDHSEITGMPRPASAAAMITAASSLNQPLAFKTLHAAMLRWLSEKVLLEGEKSLDLLQAVMITSVWFHPPDRLEAIPFYQWTHIAGTMALELGLGGRTSRRKNEEIVAAFAEQPTEAALESFRTMFGVYISCSRLAISFGRQRMLSFSDSTNFAIDVFDKHSRDFNDKKLTAWTKLQTIAEQIESMKLNTGIQRQLDTTQQNNTKNDVSIFDERLNSWIASSDEGVISGTLLVDYHFCRAKLHEVTLYVNHDTTDDLSLPLLSQAKQQYSQETHLNALNPAYVRGLLAFVQSCHSILDAVLAMSAEDIRCCPILTHFRVPYAFKALALLNQGIKNPRDCISSVLDDDSLRLDHYYASISRHMETASCQGLYAFPQLALRIRDKARRPHGAPETAPLGEPHDLADPDYVDRAHENHPSSVIRESEIPTTDQLQPNYEYYPFIGDADWSLNLMDWQFSAVDSLSFFDSGLPGDSGNWPG